MAKSEQLTVRNQLFKILLLAVLSLLFSVGALFIGSVHISLNEFFNSLFSYSDDNTLRTIILDIRLPRIILAFAVGGGLSVAGAAFQAILMNPLAEPYILGISSGGAFGAVLSFLIGASFLTTQIFSFSGALIVIAVVFILGKRFGELEPNTLLLTGVMVGAFLSALILIMISLLNESLRSAVFWLMGNLSDASNGTAYYILAISTIVSFLLILNSNKYNILTLGTENAHHLGIKTKTVRNYTYILSSILVGAIVSVSGIIGFVGLLVPHVCRTIFGSDNRIVLPASFFGGAAFLIFADTFARIIISPAELPVGAITALFGAPVFIYLLRKRFYADGERRARLAARERPRPARSRRSGHASRLLRRGALRRHVRRSRTRRVAAARRGHRALGARAGLPRGGSGRRHGLLRVLSQPRRRRGGTRARPRRRAGDGRPHAEAFPGHWPAQRRGARRRRGRSGLRPELAGPRPDRRHLASPGRP